MFNKLHLLLISCSLTILILDLAQPGYGKFAPFQKLITLDTQKVINLAEQNPIIKPAINTIKKPRCNENIAEAFGAKCENVKNKAI
jgi:hypothetical protein